MEHSETTLSLMRLLGYADERLEFSAGFVIELRKPRSVFFLFLVVRSDDDKEIERCSFRIRRMPIRM